MPIRRIVSRLLAASVLAVLCTCKQTGSATRSGTRKAVPVKGRLATLTTGRTSFERPEDIAKLLQLKLPVSIKPKGWPQQVAWRPLRYSGPFTSGSDLQNIQIVLQGTSGTVYYNNFFAAHPDADIYKRYYRINWGNNGSFAGTVLPSNVTPPVPVRGKPPTNDGANSIRLELQRIEYSSRYGGTVRLVFGMASYPTENNQVHSEDFNFEFRYGDYLFDVTNLEMSTYVYPLPSSFNPTTQLPLPSTINNPYVGTEQVEFTNGTVTAYKYINEKVVAVPFDDAARAALEDVEARVASGVPSSYSGATHAQRFALGWLHGQFQSLFQALSDPTDGVDKLWLSDNFADVTTKTRTAVFSLSFSLDDITLVDDDMEFWATNYHLYANGDEEPRSIQSYPDDYGLGMAYVVRPLEDSFTPWIHMGTWNVSECASVVGDSIQMRLADPGFFSTTSYGYEWFKVTFDCTAIRQAAQQGEWGIVDRLSQHIWFEELDPSDPPLLASYHAIILATANARVVLGTR